MLFDKLARVAAATYTKMVAWVRADEMLATIPGFLVVAPDKTLVLDDREVYSLLLAPGARDALLQHDTGLFLVSAYGIASMHPLPKTFLLGEIHLTRNDLKCFPRILILQDDDTQRRYRALSEALDAERLAWTAHPGFTHSGVTRDGYIITGL